MTGNASFIFHTGVGFEKQEQLYRAFNRRMFAKTNKAKSICASRRVTLMWNRLFILSNGDILDGPKTFLAANCGSGSSMIKKEWVEKCLAISAVFWNCGLVRKQKSIFIRTKSNFGSPSLDIIQFLSVCFC